MDWQPIETAPRDGTPILVSDGSIVEVASWSCSTTSWNATSGVLLGEGLANILCEPTCWMPLPKPPSRHPLRRIKQE